MGEENLTQYGGEGEYANEKTVKLAMENVHSLF